MFTQMISGGAGNQIQVSRVPNQHPPTSLKLCGHRGGRDPETTRLTNKLQFQPSEEGETCSGAGPWPLFAYCLKECVT